VQSVERAKTVKIDPGFLSIFPLGLANYRLLKVLMLSIFFCVTGAAAK
jgi:hypothetical protein